MGIRIIGNFTGIVFGSLTSRINYSDNFFKYVELCSLHCFD
jgi:hypothetical protein